MGSGWRWVCELPRQPKSGISRLRNFGVLGPHIWPRQPQFGEAHQFTVQTDANLRDPNGTNGPARYQKLALHGEAHLVTVQCQSPAQIGRRLDLRLGPWRRCNVRLALRLRPELGWNRDADYRTAEVDRFNDDRRRWPALLQHPGVSEP